LNAMRIYKQSDEIKEMQRKITAALVNKERSAQINEGQYRRQLDLEHDCHIDKTLLQVKEVQDLIDRDAEARRQQDRLQNKYSLQ